MEKCKTCIYQGKCRLQGCSPAVLSLLCQSIYQPVKHTEAYDQWQLQQWLSKIEAVAEADKEYSRWMRIGLPKAEERLINPDCKLKVGPETYMSLCIITEN